MHKTLFCVLMMIGLLTACGGEGRTKSADELATDVRTEYRAASHCRGTAAVTVDYGDRVYDFTLQFNWSREGETTLTVLSPEELAGLTAVIGAGESRLEFQGASLGTGDLTGEGFTPLEFLPTVLNWLNDGYMAEYAAETLDGQECLRILFRDPECGPQEGLEGTLWLAVDGFALLRAELSYDGALVLHSDFTSFTLGENTDGTEQNEDLG